MREGGCRPYGPMAGRILPLLHLRKLAANYQPRAIRLGGVSGRGEAWSCCGLGPRPGEVCASMSGGWVVVPPMGEASAVPAGASRPAVRPALSLRSKGRKGMAGASRPAWPTLLGVSGLSVECLAVISLLSVLGFRFASHVCGLRLP